MEGRPRYRRRTSKSKSEPGSDKFSTLLIGQSIICGVIFLVLILIKTVNGSFYNNMESTIKGSGFGNNLSALNTKIAQKVKDNPVITKIFGTDGAVSVFSWFKSGSASKAASSTSASSSSVSSSSDSGASSTSDSSSGSSSGSSASGSSKSSSSASGSKTVSSKLGFGTGGTGDGLIFQYGYLNSGILKVYELSGEIEEEDIIIPDKNTKVLPSNVSLQKIAAPEKVYKPISGGHLTSKFDFREDPFTGEFTFHTGLDIGIAQGTAVKSAMSGTVIATGTSSTGGKFIKIQHKNGFVTYYGHLSKILVKKDAKIKTNTKIALSGNTGRSTGPHLHFEIRHNDIRLNPALYITV